MNVCNLPIISCKDAKSCVSARGGQKIALFYFLYRTHVKHIFQKK